MTNSLRWACAVACLLPAACSTPGGGSAGFVMFDRNQHVAGVGPLDGTPGGVCLNNSAYVVGLFNDGVLPLGLPRACSDLMTNLQRAQAKVDPKDAKLRTEAIAKSLMAASEGQCDSYRNFLTQFHGNVRATFGIGAQVAAIIAAVATGNAAQWFAGAAGGLAGAGGTLNNAHFYDQALPTITQAFNQRRAKKRDDIDKKFAAKGAYEPGDALHDVQEYHNDCSLSAGLEELSKSLKEASSPSFDTLKTYITQQKESRQALINFLKEEAKEDAAATGAATETGTKPKK